MTLLDKGINADRMHVNCTARSFNTKLAGHCRGLPVRATLANLPPFRWSDFSGFIIDSYVKIRLYPLNFIRYINLDQNIGGALAPPKNEA